MKSFEEHARMWFLQTNEMAREHAKGFGQDKLSNDMQNEMRDFDFAVEHRRKDLATLGALLSVMVSVPGFIIGVILGVMAALNSIGVWWEYIFR